MTVGGRALDKHLDLVPLTHCSEGGCPTIFAITGNSDDLAVQGYSVEVGDVPNGESVVVIPRRLLEQLSGAANSGS